MYKQYKAKNSKDNILSKIDILGSFDFTTCLIALDSIEDKDMKKLSNTELQSAESNLNYRKVLPLAIHEYTHFIDSTSTVWGINHLTMMNDAYLSNDKINKDEKLFYKTKIFYNHLAKIKYPKYYNVINSDSKEHKPWVAYPTIGILFNSDGQITDESIIFLRFSSLEMEEIARSPISAVSILEASAMAQEIVSEIGILTKLNKEDLAMENILYTKKLMSIIYDKELTEYSACVHMLANQQQCKDILQSFLLVSIITRVVLNCTEDIFTKIITNNQLTNIFNIPETESIIKRLQDGLKYQNIGVLYYIIVFGLPEKSYLTEKTAIEGLKQSLKKLGITIDDIQSSATNYIENKITKLEQSSLSSITQIAKASKENFNKISITSSELIFHELNLPKVFLGDCTEILIFKNENNSLSEFNLDKCFNELAEGSSWVNRFSEACI